VVRRLHPAVAMLVDDSRVNEITRKILGAAIEVHRILGPGLLESIYLSCLEQELALRGLRFVIQHAIPIVYKGRRLAASYRLDLIVEDAVVVEIKSVAALTQVHEAQALTYLRLTGCTVALLINFNVPRLMDGVRRLINSRAVERAKVAPQTDKPQSRRDTETRREDSGSAGRPAAPAD
jgi:GxxExxY protein